MTPEEEARQIIDEKLGTVGWKVQDRAEMDLTAGPGIAVREFSLRQGFGEADYMLYADRKAVGVVEAKPVGHTLTGVEAVAARYADGLPENLPAHCRPLLCAYQSNGEQIRFTNNLDPDARSRDVFQFHRPETLVACARQGAQLRARLRRMPPLDEGRLWSAQIEAIQRTEESLAHGRPRALIQMATGSGKTFMAANLVYRLIKHADARRVLFLVDRFLLGRQANSEFTRFKPPDDNRQFGDLHVIQHMRSNKIDPATYTGEHTGTSGGIVTEDLGMKLRCKTNGVAVYGLDPSLRLTSPRDDLERKNRQLQAKLEAIEGQMPDVSIVAVLPDEAPKLCRVLRISAPAQCEPFDTTHEMQKEEERQPLVRSHHLIPAVRLGYLSEEAVHKYY